MLKVTMLEMHHDRNSFDCGVDELNGYLKKTARQHSEKGISKTFVLINDISPSIILGFMTLLICEIRANDLPPIYIKKYPSIVPAAKLGRLAISKKNQRQGLGSLLLIDSMRRIIAISKNIGIIGFFVDEKNEAAKNYYEAYGFISLPQEPLKLFLPMKEIISEYTSLTSKRRAIEEVPI